MLLEVVLEDEVTCPRCAKLEPILRKMCNELGIPLIIKYLGNRAVAAYEESVASHTFTPEWVAEWGLREHKQKLRKIAPVLSYLSSIGAQAVPNIIIRWHDGIRMKEIVIRGFDDSDEERLRQFLSNLYTLLKMLRRVVMGR